MINSYFCAFGEPKGEASETAEVIASELFSEFEFSESVHVNRDKFVSVLRERFADDLPLSDDDKAHILEMSFHNANENFYELEDEGLIDDQVEAQADFLGAVQVALQLV
jgi:hypothetical protein